MDQTLDRSLAVRPRRWYVAVILNVASGTGYLYLGRPVRAVVAAVWGLLALFALANGLGGWLATPLGVLALVLGSAGFLIFVLIDAARIARLERAFVLQRYNKWWVYVAWLACFTGVGFMKPFASTSGGAPIRAFSIPSRSMEPTVRLGDHVIADMRAYDRAEPAPGDVAVFRDPRSESTIFVKRIVGVPGDDVQMIKGVLHLNKRAVMATANGTRDLADAGTSRAARAKILRETLPNGRSYDTLDQIKDSVLDTTEPLVVPSGHYFVIGDNRDDSIDSRSRQFGFIPRQNFIGKMITVYWSWTLGRIGNRVE